MEIFVGNLPANTSVLELRRLFGNLGERARFRLCQAMGPDGARCCYGRAVIEPDHHARRVLDELEGTELRGRTLLVREFIHRNHANERRSPRWQGPPWNGLERRRGERRNGA